MTKFILKIYIYIFFFGLNILKVVHKLYFESEFANLVNSNVKFY